MTGSASFWKQIFAGTKGVWCRIFQGCVLSSGTANKLGHLGKDFYCLALVSDRTLP
jgi:hypothetical protein